VGRPALGYLPWSLQVPDLTSLKVCTSGLALVPLLSDMEGAGCLGRSCRPGSISRHLGLGHCYRSPCTAMWEPQKSGASGMLSVSLSPSAGVSGHWITGGGRDLFVRKCSFGPCTFYLFGKSDQNSHFLSLLWILGSSTLLLPPFCPRSKGHLPAVPWSPCLSLGHFRRLCALLASGERWQPAGLIGVTASMLGRQRLVDMKCQLLA
jgi:hypothetical protein